MSDKWGAIAHVNSHIGRKLLNHQNTHFANVNKAEPVWWLTVPRKKVGKQLYILLKRKNGGLIWLNCPPGTLDNVTFRYRPDKDAISLVIDTSLRDRYSRHDFSPYVELELV